MGSPESAITRQSWTEIASYAPRQLRGYKGMPILVDALHTHAERIDRIDEQQEVA